MRHRITQNDLYKSVELLESKLNGLKLTVNIYHRHYSVHVLHGSSACGEQIASGVSARECYNEVHAACKALEVNARIDELKERQNV